MRKTQVFFPILCGVALAIGGAGGVFAQDDGQEPFTWRSLRYDVANMRVGPSREYPISWVYKRKGLPVRVLRTRDEWKYVEDPDGTRGWMSESQLSGARGVVVTGEAPVALREEPVATAALKWRAEPGVVARLIECREGWCEIDVAGREGWVEASRLWGDEESAGAG